MSVRSLWLSVYLFALSTLIPSQPLQAAFVFAESPNQELSDDNLLPTDMGTATVGTNVNTVSGSTVFTGSIDADIFTFVVPTGHVLDDIRLIQYSAAPVSNNMYLAIAAGNTFPFDVAALNDNTNFPDVNLLLGSGAVGNIPANPNPPFAHLGASVGVNMLSYLATANDPGRQSGAGFTPPLPAGAYTVYIQETAASANYTLSFNVSAVPEPTSMSLLGVLGLPGLIFRRRATISG